VRRLGGACGAGGGGVVDGVGGGGQISDTVVVQASPAVVCSPFVLNRALLQRPYQTFITLNFDFQ